MGEITSTARLKRCTVYGYLYGALCDDLRVWDRLGGVEVVAVPSDNNDETIDSFARPNRASARQVVRDVEEPEFKNAASNSAMRAETDENGAFCFDNPDFQGGLLDLYVCIRSVPAPSLEKGHVSLEEPCYLFLGTFRPRQIGDSWYLILVVPAVVWCRVRAKADLWVIVGRVTPCEDDSVGLGQLKVTARDADIVQHDVLGTAVTNPNGIFRIDYPGVRFRQGTWLDIELFGGPDIYFEITDSDGNTPLDEAPIVGHGPGRANRDHCFCVHLCVDVPPPPVGPVPSVWTKVGSAFTIPDSSGLNDFHADGYAGPEKYAFHSSVNMVGSAPNTTNAGNPVEYRFRVSDSTASNSDPDLAEGAFTRVVGVGTDVGLFSKTLVGQMIRYSPYKVVDIFAIQADLDDGWLDVNTSITRTFTVHPTLTPADIADFEYVDLDPLMKINTNGLTSEANVPNVGNPGVPVPGGNQIDIERKALRFEIREVVNKAANLFNTMPGSGQTLNNIVVNNNAAYLKVAMTEHLSSTACTPLSGTPHVAFTAHHAHVGSVNINVRSNDWNPAINNWTYNHNLNDAVSKPATSDAAIPLSGNTNSPGVNHLHNPAVELPGTLHKCTYIVTLGVSRRLHNGESPVNTGPAQTSFYYEP